MTFNYDRYKNAIVSITTSIHIKSTLVDKLVFDSDVSQVTTGFFIRNHYIVTVGHGVLFKPVNVTSDVG